MRSTSQPSWEVRESEGGREIRLSGLWTLIPVSRAGHDLSRRLRELSPRAEDVWNIEHVDSLDSAGALFLWRAWGRRTPEGLRARDDQRPLFKHLQNAEEQPPHAPRSLLQPLVVLGARLVGMVTNAGEMLLLLGRVMVDGLYCVRNPRAIPWQQISATVYRAGAQSLLLLALVGALVGVVLTYQIADQLKQFGQSSSVVGAVGLAFLRELGPFITSIIIVGRSGASFTAGIGAMQITGEIDALRAFGASPTLRLVFPKVIGLASALPLLIIWTDFWGIVGAVFVSSSRLDVGYQMWLLMFPGAVPWSNFFIGFGKGILFGAMIAVVASYYGLTTRPDTQSLTENTIRSVVLNLTLVVAIDGFIGLGLTNTGI